MEIYCASLQKIGHLRWLAAAFQKLLEIDFIHGLWIEIWKWRFIINCAAVGLFGLCDGGVADLPPPHADAFARPERWLEAFQAKGLRPIAAMGGRKLRLLRG